MSTKDKVLQAMKESSNPVNISDIVKMTGLDKKNVEKIFNELKKEQLITSPVRCKWELINK